MRLSRAVRKWYLRSLNTVHKVELNQKNWRLPYYPRNTVWSLWDVERLHQRSLCVYNCPFVIVVLWSITGAFPHVIVLRLLYLHFTVKYSTRCVYILWYSHRFEFCNTNQLLTCCASYNITILCYMLLIVLFRSVHWQCKYCYQYF